MQSNWKNIDWQTIAQRLVECSACTGTGQNHRIPAHKQQSNIELCAWCDGHGFFDFENQPQQRGVHETIPE